jgi:hypothetical protein
MSSNYAGVTQDDSPGQYYEIPSEEKARSMSSIEVKSQSSVQDFDDSLQKVFAAENLAKHSNSEAKI